MDLSGLNSVSTWCRVSVASLKSLFFRLNRYLVKDDTSSGARRNSAPSIFSFILYTSNFILPSPFNSITFSKFSLCQREDIAKIQPLTSLECSTSSCSLSVEPCLDSAFSKWGTKIKMEERQVLVSKEACWAGKGLWSEGRHDLGSHRELAG